MEIEIEIPIINIALFPIAKLKDIKSDSTKNSILKKLKTMINKEKKVTKINRTLNDTDALAEAEGDAMMIHIHKDPITRNMIADDVSAPKNLDAEEIAEKKVDDIALDISDMHKIRTLVSDLRDDLIENVMGNLPNSVEINRMQRSYEIYESIDDIRKKYYYSEMRILQKADYVKKIVDFSMEYAENHEDKEEIKQMLTEDEVELDDHNRQILIILLSKLKEKTDKLYEDISVKLKNIFDEMSSIKIDETNTQSEKVGKMIETSIHLTIFENDVIETLITQILKLYEMILDNPKYDHMAKSFDKEFEPPENAEMAEQEKLAKAENEEEGEDEEENVKIFEFRMSLIFLVLATLIGWKL